MIKSRARAQAAITQMAHQKVSLAHDLTTPIVFDTSDAGTGKTAVRIWAFAERRRRGGGCLLVLAPRTLLRNVWANDFQKFAPDMKVSVATAANRKKAFGADVDVYITNHDASKELVKYPKGFWPKFSELDIDESTKYKHHTSQRAKAAGRIAHFKNWKKKACMTATPNSNAITDVWHQVYLLDGGRRLGPTFYGFRNAVATPEQQGRNPDAIHWHDKDGAEEAVFGLLADIVIRHRREDCVDIPATHYHTLPYELPFKQRKVYDTMQAAQLMVLQAAHKVTAVNAAAVATKLLQIASGAVYDNDGVYHVIDTSRYELILDLVEARKHPLVLFFWKHQKELLAAEAKKRSLRYAVLDGETSDADRMSIVTRYQMGQFDVVFGHPETVAHGLTMTRGTSIIWPGPTYNLEWWAQANLRQARIGQTEKTEIVTVLADDTIEQHVYDICMGKDKRMSNLLDLFASLTPISAASNSDIANKRIVA